MKIAILHDDQNVALKKGVAVLGPGTRPLTRGFSEEGQLREAARWSFRTCCYSGKSRLIEVSKSRCRCVPRLSV